ncbi:MAG: ABC transporter substrate-binding protein, partial [Hyphomicrobiaceae bacterium]
MNPAKHIEIERFVVNWALRNNLTEVAVDNVIIPELAESWDSSPDFKTWTFKLRKGVEFLNGTSLTAEDVGDSRKIHRGP